MGLSNERTGGTIVYASKGKFQTKSETGGYKEFAFLRGHLCGIQFSDKKGHEGKVYRQMLLHFVDGSEQFSLSLDSTNGYSRAIKACLASVDSFEWPLEINLSFVPETKAAGAFVSQRGQTAKWLWTRNQKPEGMPEVKLLGNVKGKQVYDFTDQENWIESYMLQNIVPLLTEVATRPTSCDHTSQDDAHDDENQDFNPEDRSGVVEDGTDVPF